MFFTPKGIVDLKYFKQISPASTKIQDSVYIVQDILTNQQYLQLIIKTKYETKENQESFYQSIMTVSNISQHISLLNIVGISYNDFNNQPYPTIFYEYFPNRSLSHLISTKHSFTPTQKYVILLGIASGMNHAYKNCLVHGSLDTSCVYLDDKCRPKIFGCKMADTNSNTTIKQDDINGYGQIALQLFQLDDKEIFSEWKQKFVSSCTTKYRLQRPEFGQIVNNLLSNRSEFGQIDESEVTTFIKLNERHANWHINQVKEDAEKGVPHSMFVYASFLSEGEKNQADKKEALNYFKKAADNGFVPAMFNYAFMLSKGSGVQVNKQEAAKYYLKAIEGGNKTAMFNYAHMLFNGDGVKCDKKEAAHLYKLAADNGNVKAMFNFAQVLMKGEGVKIDKIEAARYFKLAADQGNAKAMSFYALMLLKGDGIDTNKDEAARYFKAAADLGQVDAMLRYAMMVEKGDGISANKDVAIHYLKMASENGNKEASERLLKLNKS